MGKAISTSDRSVDREGGPSAYLSVCEGVAGLEVTIEEHEKRSSLCFKGNVTLPTDTTCAGYRGIVY
jgi:hypothetical protein